MCWFHLPKATSLLRQWWISWGIKKVASTWRACSWLQEVWCLWFPQILLCQGFTILQQLQTLKSKELDLTLAGKASFKLFSLQFLVIYKVILLLNRSVFKPFIFVKNTIQLKDTTSPSYGPDDPVKKKPRFQSKPNRKHNLFVKHEMVAAILASYKV